MKLSKSKLALAKIINENGGWIGGEPEWAAQDNCIEFFRGGKPEYKSGDGCWHSNSLDGTFVGGIACDEKGKNWHQTILSREEYYQAYPEVTERDAIGFAGAINLIDGGYNPKADADGWIEWAIDELPVEKGTIIDVKYSDGDELHGAPCGEVTAGLVSIRGEPASAEQFGIFDDGVASIIAYRLHKPEVKPEFCESVARSIPEPEAKPTIEQLAQDYRNAKDYADRLQKEAGEAAVKAESFAVEIRKKILDLQELIGISRPEKELELVITDCRDLMIGDEVECTEYDSEHRFGVVCRIDASSEEQPIMVYHGDGRGISWPSSWKFIRRP